MKKKTWKNLNDAKRVRLPDRYDACFKDEIFKLSRRPCNWGILITNKAGTVRECALLTRKLHRLMGGKPYIWVKGYIDDNGDLQVTNWKTVGWQPW